MLTRTFWADTAERALKTAAQTAVALLAADGVNLLSLDWTAAGATVGTTALLSVLTSIGSLTVGPPGTPSLLATPGRHALDD